MHGETMKYLEKFEVNSETVLSLVPFKLVILEMNNEQWHFQKAWMDNIKSYKKYNKHSRTKIQKKVHKFTFSSLPFLLK